MQTRFPRLLAAVLALSLAAAACGDSDAGETPIDAGAEESTDDAPAGGVEDEEAAAADDGAMEEDAEAADDGAMEEDDGAMEEDAGAEAADLGTIVDVAAANGSFATLVAAIQAAGLVDTLSGEGPFTVLAPTDEAFAAALTDLGLTAEELLADTDLLTSVLTYHVIAGEVPSSEVVALDGQSVATLNGADVTIAVDGDTVMISGATVTAVDVAASNGVIHVIDTVLLPPG